MGRRPNFNCFIYTIKGNGACSTVVVSILQVESRHIFDPGWGQKVKTLILFSEISHFAYQMKGNGAWSTIQAHNLSDPCVGVKRSNIFFSLKVVMLHTKLKGMESRAQCKYIFIPYAHTLSVGSGQKVKVFVLNVAMLHIKLERKNYGPTYKQNR